MGPRQLRLLVLLSASRTGNGSARPRTKRGESPRGIPINMLYVMADLASPAASNSNILVGTNHDTLYAVGWLNFSKQPVTLHVLDTSDRYYSVQFVDPRGDVFAYVGSTRTKAGDYLVSGPGWQGKLLDGVATRIASPNMLKPDIQFQQGSGGRRPGTGHSAHGPASTVTVAAGRMDHCRSFRKI
jgi:Protein of unknown function (DUF1254)